MRRHIERCRAALNAIAVILILILLTRFSSVAQTGFSNNAFLSRPADR
jgi:hypothetical protein